MAKVLMYSTAICPFCLMAERLLKSNGVEEGVYQTVLTVTVTAKVADKTLFLVEAAQAGIFVVRNVPAPELEAILGIACPNILFPYVREVVSDTVTRAGFPPVVLSP